jgi:SAM-dependent methyltransferase
MSRVTEEAVVWAYQLLLDVQIPPGTEVGGLLAAYPDISSLRNAILTSREFRSKVPHSLRFPLDGAEPALAVEWTVADSDLELLVERVTRTWTDLGERDPFWSVLTAEKYRGRPSEETVREFFETGASEVQRLRGILAHCGKTLGSRGRCLELGCGLGRVTRHLSAYFGATTGADISSTHLNLAREMAIRESYTAIEWLHLDSPRSLEKLPEADFIYSNIVLQHSPPPIIDLVLRRFARLLRPGGIAVFQLPTYRYGYRFAASPYLKTPETGMEMHVFPQWRVFDIFAMEGATPLAVLEDGATGDLWGRSNLFVFERRTDTSDVCKAKGTKVKT